MNPRDALIKNAPEIEAKIGYSFKDRSLLALAFVHRSFVNENKEVSNHNERLEFLGDSVLGLIIAEYLYRYLPSTPEGDLSILRSRLVEASSCLTYVEALEIEQHLLLGRGEKRNDGRGRESILADLFEAIIGAIYLDQGYETTKKFLKENLFNKFDQIKEQKLYQDSKSLLQEIVQSKGFEAPVYKVTKEDGPDHDKQFTIEVLVNSKPTGTGVGKSKQLAQQAAAQEALDKLAST